MKVDPQHSRGILESHRLQMASKKARPFTRERSWKVICDPDVRNEPRQDINDVVMSLKGMGRTTQALGDFAAHECNSVGCPAVPLRWSRY